MPTYEYACTDCKNQWEEIQKISEPALQTCPKCNRPTAQRQISGGRFILKGGGWYADLYSSSKPGKKDDGGSSSESKGDTKTAAKGSSEGGSSAPSQKESPAAASKESASTAPSSPPASKN